MADLLDGGGSKGPQQVVRRGDVERANNAYMKAVELLYDVKLLPRALSLMTEAICIKPRNAVWYMGRGQVYRAMGRYHHALYDFNAVIKLEPRNAPCYCLRSVCLRKLRKFAAALSDMNTSLQLEPDNSAFRFYRALILSDVDELGPAIEDFTAAADNERYSFRARMLRAQCHEKRGHLAEAMSDLLSLVRLEPHNSAGYDALAALLLRQGHYHEALQQLNAAMPHLAASTYPPSLLLARRSEALFALQRYGAALADAQLAVAAAAPLNADAAGQHALLKPLVSEVPCDPEAPSDAPLSQPSSAYALSLADVIVTRDTAYLLLRRGLAYLAAGHPLAALPDLLHACAAADAMVRRAEAREPGQRGEGDEGGDGKGTGEGRRSSCRATGRSWRRSGSRMRVCVQVAV
jgi:tetratricopeptide (TPR) repeat protein